MIWPSHVICFCVFIKEARCDDGKPYTPRSLTQLLSGIQRFINSKRESTEPLVKLQDTSNGAFRELQHVQLLEHRFRELYTEGVGTKRKQAEVISRSCSEEEILWGKGVLTRKTLLGLLNAVFYYNGINFVLRGRQEHRDFKISQLKLYSVENLEKPTEKVEVVMRVHRIWF